MGNQTELSFSPGELLASAANLPSPWEHKRWAVAGVAASVALAFAINNSNQHENKGTHIAFSNLAFEERMDLRVGIASADEHITSEAEFELNGLPNFTVEYDGRGKVLSQFIVPWSEALSISDPNEANTQEVEIDLSKIQVESSSDNLLWKHKVDVNEVLNGVLGMSGNSDAVTGMVNDMNEIVEAELNEQSLNAFGPACGDAYEPLVAKRTKRNLRAIAKDFGATTKLEITTVGEIKWPEINDVELNKKGVTLGNPKYDSVTCDTSDIRIDKLDEDKE